MAIAPERKVEAAENARSTWPVGPTLTGPEGWFGGLTVLRPAPRSARGFGDMEEEEEEEQEEVVEVVEPKSCSKPIPRVSSLAAACGPIVGGEFRRTFTPCRASIAEFLLLRHTE